VKDQDKDEREATSYQSESSATIEETLRRIQLHNESIDRENAALQAKLRQLETVAASRGYRYAHGLEQLYRSSPLGRMAGRVQAAARQARAAAIGARTAAQDAVTTARQRVTREWTSRLVGWSSEQQRLVRTLEQRPEVLKIALSWFGGLGDALMTTPLLEQIKLEHPRCELYVITNIKRRLGREVLRDNPYITDIFLTDEIEARFGLPGFMQMLVDHDLLDIWYEGRYQVVVHYAPHAPVPPEQREVTDRTATEMRINFEKFPEGSNLLSTAARRRGLSLIGYAAESAGLELDDAPLFYFPTEKDLAIVPTLAALGDYVTIHHGSDPVEHRHDGIQTKNWFTGRWEAVIANLVQEHGVTVVQLGTSNEIHLQGANHAFMGRASLGESALVLQRALLHLDSEGGLVHLARATHTPSLVLFGPTPPDFFGYPGNVNVQAGDCHDCWWSTHNWADECPRGLVVPACMDEIRPPAVTRAVDELLSSVRARRPLYRLEHVAFSQGALPSHSPETLRQIYAAAGLPFPGPTPAAAPTLDEETGVRVEAADHWAYLQVLERLTHRGADAHPLRILQVGAGRGALALYLAARDHEVHVCDRSFGPRQPEGRGTAGAFFEAMRGRLRVRYGTPLNLPYENAAFDVVLAVSALDEPALQDTGTRELVRLLAPGGMLVLTFAAPTAASAARFAQALAPLGVVYEPDVPVGATAGALTIVAAP
jgi:ADP-heptose:LPS heptosyltransferase/SAM-dependent methyltransferase